MTRNAINVKWAKGPYTVDNVEKMTSVGDVYAASAAHVDRNGTAGGAVTTGSRPSVVATFCLQIPSPTFPFFFVTATRPMNDVQCTDGYLFLVGREG